MATATLQRPLTARPVSPGMVANRLEWVDTAKGIGIILVVFGHVWRGLKTADLTFPAGLYPKVDDWIYSFHMPLFFVLSGLFAGRAAERPVGVYLGDKLKTIAYPYLLWSVIQGVMNLALARHTNTPLTAAALTEQILIRPYGQFWFLYVLMIQFLVFLPLAKIGLRPGMIVMVAVATPLLLKQAEVPLVPILGVALDFLGYFALGNWLHGWTKSPRLTIPTVILMVISVGSAGILAAGSEMHVLGRPGVRVVAALIGLFGVLAMSLALQRLRLGSWLAEIGRASLPIFVAHILATAACRMLLLKVGHCQNLSIHLFLGTLVGLAFPCVVDHLARRIGFRSLFSLKL